ncbi:methyltransferase domain-containing protein [Streptomyces lincolnensis]|uniref:methyltransferase domain-containing protein n=1 Tax=Streptomyces lincolnensis TaxID=1915 RepID=UPI001E61E415|nr:methyltransferase domain-containing protein [Streptomyces lincolnensis]MCD7445719.1 methyltransferase domain-containing protein [Streptomyces lincolnensis]
MSQTETPEDYYRRTLTLSGNDVTREDRPETFTLYGREWDLLGEVFAPIYRPSTNVSLDFLGLLEPGRFAWDSMLEMGSGTGLICVTAALAGCGRVVGADINPHAVENTRLNAARHGVDDRVRAVHSDLFDGLDESERFDVIFWNSNYIWAPEDHRFESPHEHAFLDPGYAAHRRFLREAPRWTTEGGSVLLFFSSTKGDLPGLHRLAEETNRELKVIRRETIEDGTDMAVSEYLLIEVTETR